MRRPLQITFHEVESSEEVRQLVEEKMAKLDALYAGIMGARVAVAEPHHSHREGNRYEVRIEITVPGGEIVVGRDPGDRYSHENVLIAVRDAFKAAERQLKSWVAVRRGDVRREHAQRPVGRVVRLFTYEGYGFLATEDGSEIYFDRGAVLNGGFERLSVGDEVHYAETSGVEGPRASTVELGHTRTS